MATRSWIGYFEGDKLVTTYAHWDGYPSHNGKLLYKHYTTVESVKELVNIGFISVLKESIKKTKTIDRISGDTDDPKIFPDIASAKEFWEDSWCEYGYVFHEGSWRVFTEDIVGITIPQAVIRERRRE